jgi:hypothetical protein
MVNRSTEYIVSSKWLSATIPLLCIDAILLALMLHTNHRGVPLL